MIFAVPLSLLLLIKNHGRISNLKVAGVTVCFLGFNNSNKWTLPHKDALLAPYVSTKIPEIFF
jgi:hypothetical protein